MEGNSSQKVWQVLKTVSCKCWNSPWGKTNRCTRSLPCINRKIIGNLMYEKEVKTRTLWRMSLRTLTGHVGKVSEKPKLNWSRVNGCQRQLIDLLSLP